MDKGDHSGLLPLSALTVFRHWLEREPTQNKVRDVLHILAERTGTAITRGDEPPVADVTQLATWHRDRFGGSPPGEPVTGKWLPSTNVLRWWKSWENSRRQFAAESGLDIAVDLIVDRGGGRSNPTTYRLAFVPLAAWTGTDAGDDPETEAAAHTDRIIRVSYEREDARGAWYVRPLLARPFAIRSLRGIAFILLVATPFLVASLAGLVSVLIVWARVGALSAWVGPLTFASVLGAFSTFALRPFWLLPLMRTTLAPEWVLAWSQMYGQLQLTRADDDRRARFSLVRHSSLCPVCAGTIEIRDGGRGGLSAAARTAHGNMSSASML